MLEFPFGSKSPVKLRLYLKFNIFKYPALWLTHERWSREKIDQDNMSLFSLSSLLGVKKKRYFSLMSVEDQVFSEKDFGHLSCVDKKI